MQVSPQRHDRLRRRRRAARIIAARRVAARAAGEARPLDEAKGTVVTRVPRIPAQRTSSSLRPSAARSASATD